MLSYFFTTKKTSDEPVLCTDQCVRKSVETNQSPQIMLEKENEQLKAQVETLLAEKVKLEKEVEHLKRESSVYRDLMFTKVCLCNSYN